MDTSTETSIEATTPEVKGKKTKLCIIPGRLDGKLAVITGSNSGIGKITAAELARRGCRVIMACRNLEKATKAREDILRHFGRGNPDSTNVDVADESIQASLQPVNDNQLVIEKLDLGSLESVRSFASRVTKTYPRIDYLINNAGLSLDQYSTTEDGFEQVMGVNYLGPFLLTNLLLPCLKQASPSKIINVASVAQVGGTLRKPDLLRSRKGYNADGAYWDSKLANVMHARELSKRLEGTGVTAVSLHPGIIESEFFRDFKSWTRRITHQIFKTMFITPREGAQTTLYTVLSGNLTPGGYYANCALKSPSRTARNEENCRWLWNKTVQLLCISEEAPV